MNSLDLFKMAFGNLWRRKLRTFLTVLGVVIGTTSIVVMLSLGLGMKKANMDMISSMGDLTSITVTPEGQSASPWGQSEAPTSPSSGRKKQLNDSAITEIKLLPGVIAVSPVKTMDMKVVFRKYESYTNIVGMDPAAMELFDMKIEEGRSLQAGDKNVAVFGGQIKNNFYDPKSSGYQTKEIKNDPLKDKYSLAYNIFDESSPSPKFDIKVVGVLSENDWNTAWDIYIPLSEFERIEKSKPKDPFAQGQNKRLQKGSYNQVRVKVDDIKNVTQVQDQLKSMGFNTYSLQDDIKEFERGTNIVQAILGGIGGISLLVAAIGITNTMIMSIYERTKEIGVMKVIGAAIDDIKKLFLLEAAFIGLAGGILGSCFSLAISKLLNYLASNSSMFVEGEAAAISIVPPWLILAALVFSAGIGLVSGYLPARRAMNLSALEAIRTE